VAEARQDLGGTTYLRLVWLGAAIGVPAAVLAALSAWLAMRAIDERSPESSSPT